MADLHTSYSYCSPKRVNEWEEILPIRAWEVILPIPIVVGGMAISLLLYVYKQKFNSTTARFIYLFMGIVVIVVVD